MAPPRRTAVRPTTDKVREAVFNALASLDVVVGARVADLYAGSGALGIEALSRGAAHCTFVERDRAAVAAIDENIAVLGLRGRTTVRVGDAIAAAPRIAHATKPDGWLIFSGVLRKQIDEVVGAFQAEGFSNPRVIVRGKWCAGTCQKNQRRAV